MGWQDIIVAIVVIAAIAVLTRRVFRWWTGTGESACGSCSQCGPAPESPTIRIISEDEITLPK